MKNTTGGRKMKKIVVIVSSLVFGIVLSVTTPTQAQMKIGINYPGFQIGYLKNKISYELRGEKGKDIWTMGPRVSFYSSSSKNGIIPFLAIEGDYISFKGSVSEGTGFAIQSMVGIAKRITSHVSAEVTAGGAYVSLKDKGTGFRESSVSPVIGMGINLYF
ncbi:MAG: hypothetical protein V1649_02125 [Patescibacteria group bacterium]